MDTSSIPRKQCSSKVACVHPEAIVGWLPSSLDYFYADRRTVEGLRSQCRKCVNAANADYDLKHPDLRREIEKRSKAAHPEASKENSARYRKQHSDRIKQVQAEYNETHREQRKLAARERRANNPDHYRKIDREWRHRNPEKVAAKLEARRFKTTTGVTADDIAIQLKAQKGLCWHCSKPLATSQDSRGRTRSPYDIDHLVPLSRGGKNIPENIVLACPFCNRSKGAKLTQEWNGKLF